MHTDEGIKEVFDILGLSTKRQRDHYRPVNDKSVDHKNWIILDNVTQTIDGDK